MRSSLKREDGKGGRTSWIQAPSLRSTVIGSTLRKRGRPGPYTSAIRFGDSWESMTFSVTLASISTVPEVLTLRTGLHSNTEDSPVGALAIESTEFRNLVILYRIHHSLPRAVSAV